MQHELQQPDAVDSSAAATLLMELEQVLDVLRRATKENETGTSQLALVRLVENITLETWREIAMRSNLRHWLALPLDKPQAESLHDFQTTLEELLYQRDHDVLTGLANRRLFDRQLHMEMERAQRTKTDLSLVMLDLDNFKNVNDTYGHPCGDQVLMRLGALLGRSLRAYDVAARIGGEEFCLILPGASGLRAQALAKRILEAFRQEQFEAFSGVVFKATFSAGVATALSHAENMDAQALLAQADGALYLAKRQGKNRVATIKPTRSFSDNPALVRAAEKKFLFYGSE